MPTVNGAVLEHVTVNVVLAVCAVVISVVPAVEGNAKVAAVMVHDAVIVIVTVKLAVAVPARADEPCQIEAISIARQNTMLLLDRLMSHDWRFSFVVTFTNIAHT
jgi:hypothetical protein